MHFSKHLPVEWFNGLTAEVRRTIKTASGVKYRWVKTAARNEPLDTTVYAMFCSQMLDHYKMTEQQWKRLENDLLPDLFDTGPAEPTHAVFANVPTQPVAAGQGTIALPQSSAPVSRSPHEPHAPVSLGRLGGITKINKPERMNGGRISLAGLRRSNP